ncbi:hypothetical protein BU15DRAFT_52887 [Melanogaster broomeanus]|nr:hypothetical protein BU15DRAFT_52887 [Melanogaster broomeanus]
MSGFAALMALSASQTKESQNAVQTALQQRQRNEELKRKKQEELAQKQREEEAKLRQQRFEEEKKQRELEGRKEAERARREAEQARREEEARNALLYGPKRAKHLGPKWPSSSTGVKDEVRRRRVAGDDADESRAGSPPMALTREEKRQRRVEAELRRTYQLKRSAASGYSKAGRHLPGGAIDSISAPASDSGASAQSVKARLAALPNTLTKLNVNKRDTRTIDEILQDRAKAKVSTLDGDEAREFNDWFGKSKRKSLRASPARSRAPRSLLLRPLVPIPRGRRAQVSAFLTMQLQQSTVKSSASTTKTTSRPSDTKTSSSSFSQSKYAPNIKASSSTSRLTSDAKYPSTAIKSSSPKPSLQSRSSAPRSGAAPPKKRARSPSLSLSPPPKRRAASPEDAIRSEIWKMFGKDRSAYITRDVVSDDEDMEADASAVMREEMRSCAAIGSLTWRCTVPRLAKREDELALEAEKRHEADKRQEKARKGYERESL